MNESRDPTPGMPGVRLLILCAGDPEAARPFSGSARSLIRALEARGVVHGKANVLGHTDPFKRGNLPTRIARRLDRFGLEDAYHWSPLCFARNSARARAAAARNPGYNAYLQYGTTFNAALAEPGYCYFDGTAAQVAAARAWEFANFSPGKTRRILAYQRAVFDHCTGIFPRTHWAAGSVVGDYGIAEEKVCVAGAGPNHFADPLPHGSYAAQRILFVGGDFDRKGGPRLLEAFRLVRAQLPGATLRIVGCTPQVNEPGVEIVGPISKEAPGGVERLLREYAEASVFCIMSTFEPFGIVVLEAQNSYVPCVAPARFAFPETIEDGVTGRLLHGDTPADLAALLCAMLSDPATLSRMGEAGHARVRAQWTWEAAAARIHWRIAEDLRRIEEGNCPAR